MKWAERLLPWVFAAVWAASVGLLIAGGDWLGAVAISAEGILFGTAIWWIFLRRRRS